MSAAGKQGPLFEGPSLRVGCSSEFRAHMCRLTLHLVNTDSASITNLKLTSAESGEVNIQVMQNPPSSLDGNKTDATKIQIQLECMKPFMESPEVTLTYSIHGITYEFPLKLPISPFSFCEPVSLDGPAYMSRWKLLEGEDRESQEVFQSGQSLSVDVVSHIKQSIFPSLHIAIADGLDSDVTVTGCCSFRTGTMSPDGSGMIVIGALMRLEADVNSGRYRITVRAKHGKVAVALKNTIKAILG